MWEDFFADDVETIQPSFTPLTSPSSCMITYLSLPDKAMFVQPCDPTVVKTIPIMTSRDYIKQRTNQRVS
jgi:hypothetical protein